MPGYPLPPDVIQYLESHPDASGAEVSRATGRKGRTVRRYVRYYKRGDYYEQTSVRPIRSKFREEYEAQTEEEFDPYDFFERAPALIAQRQRRDPIITHDEFSIDTDKPIGILFVSCMHLGGQYTFYPEFRSIYDKALQIPNLYWGSLGDDIDGFAAYFSDTQAVEDQLINVPQQLALLEAVLSPLAETNRLLFGCGSQHPAKWERHRTGKDSVKQIYMNFGVPYFDGAGYVKLQVGDITYFVALAHEFPGSSMWNPNYAHARASRLRFPMADVVVAGDKHSMSYQHYQAYIDEWKMGNRQSPDVHLLQAGTAKNGPDPYTIKNFPTGGMGWPIVIFSPHEHCIRVVDRLDDAIKFLGE